MMTGIGASATGKFYGPRMPALLDKKREMGAGIQQDKQASSSSSDIESLEDSEEPAEEGGSQWQYSLTGQRDP